ncbi:MAG: hypothetical protein ACJ8CR_29745 [Roseiflexaceae bacterium]
MSPLIRPSIPARQLRPRRNHPYRSYAGRAAERMRVVSSVHVSELC